MMSPVRETVCQGFTHGSFDGVGFLAHVETKAQHHGPGKNGGKGVGLVLARNVRRRAVDGLEQAGAGSPMEAEGNIPSEQVTDASSDRMSPKILPVRITSKLRGVAHQLHGGIVHIHVGQLHIGILAVRFENHFLPQARSFQSTLLFSTEHTLPRRLRAVSKATVAIRRISSSLYTMVL